jgi:hypothetical protein
MDVGRTGTASRTPFVRVVQLGKLIGDTQRISRQLRTHSNRIRPADRAWLALAIGVGAYELMAREGELMSHSYDRWLLNHPVMTWGATLITAAHLLNMLPERCDPYVLGFVAWRKR